MKLTLPHWVIVALSVLLAIAPKVAEVIPAAAPTIGVLVQLLPLVLGALGISTASVSNAANVRAALVKASGAVLALVVGCVALLAAVVLAGCMTSTAIGPVTQDNQAQVSNCQGIANLHNEIVVGDYAVGALGAGAGIAAAAEQTKNPGLASGLAVGAAIGAALAGGGTGLAAFTASEFQAGQCGNFVGPLPAGPLPMVHTLDGGAAAADGGAQ